jgi:hypothetical protein
MTCESIVIRFKAEDGRQRVLTATGKGAATWWEMVEELIDMQPSVVDVNGLLTETFETVIEPEPFTDDHVAGEKPGQHE